MSKGDIVKITLLPKTRTGTYSVCLFVGFIALAIMGSYISSAQDNTIEYPNPFNSPLLGTVIYLSFAVLFGAAVTGLIAVIKEKERSILVYFIIPTGIVVTLFGLMLLIGGLIGPPNQ